MGTWCSSRTRAMEAEACMLRLHMCLPTMQAIKALTQADRQTQDGNRGRWLGAKQTLQ